MRRTTPDLVASRQSVYVTASRVLLALSIGYALWTTYNVFVGGNLPLTPIDLGGGSFAGGLFMLAIGDLIMVLVLWFVVDAALLNLLHMVLRSGSGARRPIPVPGRTSTAGRSPFAVYPAVGSTPNQQSRLNQQGRLDQQGDPAPRAGFGQQDSSAFASPPGSAWSPPASGQGGH